jgi:hypothetical protein
VANLDKMLNANGCVTVQATGGRARHVVLEPSGPLLSVQLSQAILDITSFLKKYKKKFRTGNKHLKLHADPEVQ